MRKFWCLAVMAAMSGIASARTQTIALWRGETATARLDSAIEVGEAPAGLRIRIGELRSVRAAPQPRSLHREEILDRVDWRQGPAMGSKCYAAGGEILASESSGERMIEVTAFPKTAPGVYRCGMVEIRVLDRLLPPPADWKYRLDLWQHPWAVARYADLQPFSREHYAAMRPLWRELAAAGQKSLTVTLVEQPWNHQCRDAYGSMISRVKSKDGHWTFDYRVFDEYVKFGRECGLGPDIACYTMCPWEYVCRYRREDGTAAEVKAVPGTPEFDDFWGEFLEDFVRHLKFKGWFKDTLIAMDERSPEDVRLIADFIRKHAPGMRISMAGNRNPADFKGIVIDSYAQIMRPQEVTPEFLQEVKSRRYAGLITTGYVCCEPLKPNTLLCSAEGEGFWCGFGPVALGLDGFLRWAYNSWPESPMTDASFGTWLAGDTFLVYPDGSPSRRFLELKQGVVAAEKMNILRSAGERLEELDGICRQFDLGAANRGEADYLKLRDAVLSAVNR